MEGLFLEDFNTNSLNLALTLLKENYSKILSANSGFEFMTEKSGKNAHKVLSDYKHGFNESENKNGTKFSTFSMKNVIKKNDNFYLFGLYRLIEGHYKLLAAGVILDSKTHDGIISFVLLFSTHGEEKNFKAMQTHSIDKPIKKGGFV
jgi:hypothetical protein